MTSASLLRVYQAAPHSVRHIAATLHGFSLRRWRYGRDTDRLVEEALERENWTPELWSAWREKRLALILRRAAAVVPYYRSLWEARRHGGDRASPEVLENWPVLSKEEVRRSPVAFLAEDRPRRHLYREQTSGTTGTPLQLWAARGTLRAWYALFEARVRRWNGVSRRDRWAILGGQLVVPVDQPRPPFWVWNAALRQLYLSSYHLAPRNLFAYVDALRRYRVRSLLGYASSLVTLARGMAEQSIPPPELRVVVSNAEPLYTHQRSLIARAFGCPVRDTYGMAELVAAGSECEIGVLHAWPEVGVLEVLSDSGNEPVAPGDAGRLIGTGLLNCEMILVRYETGDRGSIAVPQVLCACGRRLPVLGPIEGRTDDILVTPDGRRIGRLDPVFKADLAIREAQIIQERLDVVRVLVVPADGFAERDAALIREGLRCRLGPSVRIDLEIAPSIARSANGKFRAVVSRIAPGREA